jgi:hypothetical protein
MSLLAYAFITTEPFSDKSLLFIPRRARKEKVLHSLLPIYKKSLFTKVLQACCQNLHILIYRLHQFIYKDYNHAGNKKLALSAIEFIRYYGMLRNALMQSTLTTIQKQLTSEQNRVQKEKLQHFPYLLNRFVHIAKSWMQDVIDFDN